MLSYVLLALGVVVIVLFVLASLQPDEFKVSRSASIPAPAATIFEHVNNFRQWEAWSPWARLDPAMQQTYSGPAAGVGACYAWTGNAKVGAGRMTIQSSEPPRLIQIQLEFLRPFKATNLAQFTFSAEGANTVVVWSMTGRSNLMTKLFGLFVNFDKMVGRDFEKGLAQLQSVVAAATKA